MTSGEVMGQGDTVGSNSSTQHELVPERVEADQQEHFTDPEHLANPNTTDMNPSTGEGILSSTHFTYAENQESALGQNTVTLNFLDQGLPNHVTPGSKPFKDVAYASFSDASLSSFLSRPIRVSNQSWTVGLGMTDNFYPLQEYLSNTVVASKISNYKLIRCTVNVRLQFNATNFHYGVVALGAIPYPEYTNVIHDVNFSGNSGDATQKITTVPHTLATIRDNTPAELSLPWCYPKTYAKIDDAQTAVSGQPWRVYYRGLGNLRVSSSTAVQSITVNAFVWLTDVELALATVETHSSSGSSSGLFSGFGNTTHATQKRELGGGPISSFASTSKSILEPLTKIPIIGEIAEVGHAVASVIGNIAAALGFSRPPIEEDARYIKTRPFTNTSVTVGAETVEKLTVDPAQSVSVDPGIMGAPGADEMSYKYISNVAPFFTSFTMDDTQAVGTELFNIQVSPMVLRTQSGTTAMTPLAGLSALHKYWRGSLVYRFYIVSSQYHNGRIKFSWEPDLPPVAGDYNTSYSTVVDVNTTRDFELVVPYSNDVDYLLVDTRGTVNYSPTPSAYNNALANGRLYAYVSNQLVSTETLTDIEIFVSVRAGNDFTLHAPSNKMISNYTMLPDPVVAAAPPTIETIDEVITQSTGNLWAPGSTMLFGAEADHDTILLKATQHFGEVQVSLRSLMKRYSRLDAQIGTPVSTDDNIISFRCKNRPIPSGFSALAVNNNGLNDVNYQQMTIHEWISLGYAFRRGAYRYKYNLFGVDGVINMATVDRGNLDGSTIKEGPAYVNLGALTSPNGVNDALADYFDFTNGSIITNGEIQPTFEVEIPYYNRFNFWSAWSTGPVGDYDFCDHYVRVLATTTQIDSRIYLQRYVSIGEDFNFHYFLGWPSLSARNY